MGLRHDILAALAKRHPEIVTIDDLMESTGETNRPRLVSNLKAAQADDLITKTRDEVTNQPAYSLTPTGLARHKAGAQQFNGKTQAANTCASPRSTEPDTTANSHLQEALSIIYDIRVAIGDPNRKIMLGELAARIHAQRTADADEIARLKARIHDMSNDLIGTGMILDAIRGHLGTPDIATADLPAAIADAMTAPTMHTPKPGRLALLLIDSADMTDLEELDTADLDAAQAEARRNIDVGNAARAVVVSIHGEAFRRTEWREAA